jgi:ribosomal protein L24E
LKLEELNQILQRGLILKMPFCSYCKKSYEIPRGMTVVMVDGTVNHFCSSKCRKNFLLKRRKVRWVLKNPENKADLKLKQENKKVREEAKLSSKKK